MSRDTGTHDDRAPVLRFLAARTRAERERAFEAIVERYRSMVLGYCAKELAPDYDAAHDTAQQTFLAAWEALHRIEEPAAAGAFLRTIAKRQSIRRRSLDRGAGRVVVEPTDDPAAFERRRDRDEAAASARREAMVLGLVERLVATLPDDHRRLYHLTVHQGLAGAELAEALGVSSEEAARLAHKHRAYVGKAFGTTVLVLEGRGCDQLKRTVERAGHRGQVMAAELRSTVTRHVGQCESCRKEREKSIYLWTPALVPVLYAAGLHRRVMEDIRLVSNASPLVAGASPPATAARRPTAGRASHRRGEVAARFRRRATTAIVIAAALAAALIVSDRAGRLRDLASDLGVRPRQSQTPPGPNGDLDRAPPVRRDTTDQAPGGRGSGGGQTPGSSPGGSARPGDGSTAERGTGQGPGGGGGPTGRERQGDGGGTGGGKGPGDGVVVEGGGVVPAPVVEHTVVVHISSASDELVASYGVGVTIGGAPQPRCTGRGADCSYTVTDGTAMEVALPGNSEVAAWADAPCSPSATTCAFTVSHGLGMNLNLQYVPG